MVLARSIAKKLGVPYHEDRVTERFLGHRLKAQPETPILDTPRYRLKAGRYNSSPEPGPTLESWPLDPKTEVPATMDDVESLTEEVWGRDYWPNTADDPITAVGRLSEGKVEALYYHGPSMCVVLLSPGGLKAGIRAAALIDPTLGPDTAGLAALSKLKRA